MENTEYITLEYVKTVIRERRRDLHKGDCGKILVIAGSKGMVGAAVICGRAAYRAGAGLVRISIDEELFPIIQTALPEATCVSRRLSETDVNSADAIAIGPGLGNFPENGKLIADILGGYGKTVVLDADGLNALAGAGKVDLLKTAAAKVIITPHMGEAKRLMPGCTETDRVKITEALIAATGAVVVLKGAGTIVADVAAGMYINTTGNPGMATGGSGDALTGIIAAFAGQALSSWDAAKAGVFIHGLAGDIAVETIGEYGLTAMDIAETTAFAIKRVTGQ